MNAGRKSRSVCVALIVFTLAMVFVPATGRIAASADGWDYVPRVVHVPILMYHYVDTPPADANYLLKDLVVTRENFEQQLKWLKDNSYTSITPDELIAALWHGAKLPAKPIMFTFDDGYASMWYNAFPLLLKYGFTGTFFVITNFVDQNKPGYLTWDEAKFMAAHGMSIEDHSRTHEDFRNRSHSWYLDEIDGSIKAIKQHIGVTPLYFCYPFGGYDNVAIRELRAAGIIAGFTENGDDSEYASNTMRLPRLRIRGGYTLSEFISTIGAPVTVKISNHV